MNTSSKVIAALTTGALVIGGATLGEDLLNPTRTVIVRPDAGLPDATAVQPEGYSDLWHVFIPERACNPTLLDAAIASGRPGAWQTTSCATLWGQDTGVVMIWGHGEVPKEFERILDGGAAYDYPMIRAELLKRESPDATIGPVPR